MTIKCLKVEISDINDAPHVAELGICYKQSLFEGMTDTKVVILDFLQCMKNWYWRETSSELQCPANPALSVVIK